MIDEHFQGVCPQRNCGLAHSFTSGWQGLQHSSEIRPRRAMIRCEMADCAALPRGRTGAELCSPLSTAWRQSNFTRPARKLGASHSLLSRIGGHFSAFFCITGASQHRWGLVLSAGRFRSVRETIGGSRAWVADALSNRTGIPGPRTGGGPFLPFLSSLFSLDIPQAGGSGKLDVSHHLTSWSTLPSSPLHSWDLCEPAYMLKWGI